MGRALLEYDTFKSCPSGNQNNRILIITLQKDCNPSVSTNNNVDLDVCYKKSCNDGLEMEVRSKI